MEGCFWIFTLYQETRKTKLYRLMYLIYLFYLLKKLQRNNKTIAFILRPCTSKVFEREYINQITKVAKDFSFLFSRDIKFFFYPRWNSELLLAKILKSSRETVWSQKSIWSLIAVVVLAFDFFPVKGETPECSPTVMFKCWHVSPLQVALYLPQMD